MSFVAMGLGFRIQLLLVVFLLLSPSKIAAADGRFLGVDLDRIHSVIDLGYSMSGEVEGAIEQLRRDYPDSPASYVLEVGYLYWTQDYKAFDQNLKERFEERSEAALEFAESYYKKHKDDPDALFAVGIVELMQVIYLVDHERWWSSFWKSRSSLKIMRKLVQEYPDYHDAKLPLGMANCYLSKTPSYLKPLAFLMRFKGDWDLGLRYMREARDEGLISRVDAGYFLGGILFELNEDREGAREEFWKLAERYPGNLRFQSVVAELDRGLNRQEAARDRAQVALRDPRLEQYPGIESDVLTTLIWSSLGSGSYGLTVEVEPLIQDFVKRYPALNESGQWATHAKAEALWAMGERDAALELWESLLDVDNAHLAKTVRERMTAVESG